MSEQSAAAPHDAKAADRRTLDAIFRHPLAHNIEWTAILRLIGHIGEMAEKHNGEFVFTVAAQHHIAHKPHSKCVSGPDVMELRHFLQRAGFSAHGEAVPAVPTDPLPPTLLIVTDHHETRLYHVETPRENAAEPIIRPYDPHHFLHHLTHKDQSRERGQRAPEEPAYYEQIAQAIAASGQLIVVGHGTGKSNAAHHLCAYLRKHHPQTAQRIVRELVADLSSITVPQLLVLATAAETGPL